jgi:glutamate/tyrosine decarboxylase-like PLP-dependent enzyme
MPPWKSHSSSGAVKGARKPPLATSTWIGIDTYFDVELREAPMTTASYELTPEQVGERCDENRIAVVVKAGSSGTSGQPDCHHDPVLKR